TSIPPHNLSEVIDGVIAYMKNPDINTQQMMKYIPGPDFPTGGIVTNQNDLLSIYSTGIGKIRLRGRVEIETGKNGRTNIVITEIPYTMIGANIGKFLNDVFHLVESKQTTDIADISNQSSKEGIRIVIEVKKGADVNNLCNLLYKKTRLEDTFSVNMLAVCDGRPETLGLVPIIRHHVDFQFDLAKRKYTTLLAKARDKKEIQEGLIKACDVIDLIIEILRGAKNIADAKDCLVNGNTKPIKFKSKQSEKDAKNLLFTERQAEAILQMRLYRLIGLEIDALREEYKKTMQDIANYTDILENRASMAKVIIGELKEFKKRYATARKTEIDNVEAAAVVEKPLEVIDVAVLIDRFGYARTIDMSTYERNIDAANDESKYIILCKNTDRIGIFTDKGNMYLAKVLDLPFGKFRDKGQPLDNVSKFNSSAEDIRMIECIENLRGEQLVFVTKSSMLKLVYGAEFDVNKRQTAATKLMDGDELILVERLQKDDTLVMCSEKNYFLRIDAQTIPEKKKAALGVRGMKLGKGDLLKQAVLLHSGDNPTVQTGGKEIALNRLHVAGRDTKGVKR
ncbi:MAG: DNA topoisomerase, partial [Lachnospiraceae bacterium]|nr:DNA topoisomerase [Lachnospiraceae bacterium]